MRRTKRNKKSTKTTKIKSFKKRQVSGESSDRELEEIDLANNDCAGSLSARKSSLLEREICERGRCRVHLFLSKKMPRSPLPTRRARLPEMAGTKSDETAEVATG